MPPSPPSPPQAPLAPTAHARGTPFLAVAAFANAGGVISYLPLLSLLLPIKIEALAGDARLDVLTAAVLAGAVASSVSNVLFGWLNDRSKARGHDRRRGLLLALPALALAYALVGAATNVAMLIAGVVAVQVAVNALLAPLFAIVADEVPNERRGIMGGLIALGSPAAGGVSALLVSIAVLSESARLAIIVAATAALVAPMLLVRARRGTNADPPSIEQLVLRRDLTVAWIARILVQIAGNVLSLYLLYYFESVVPTSELPNLPTRVGHVLTLGFLLPVPFALWAGRLSDRTHRRKPFLMAAAAVAAAGLLGMAVARDWAAGAAAFALYAIGSSVFLALHATFAMQLLPSAEHRGRDLGILNLTNTLPALVGPLLTWWLATPHDFGPAMATLGGLTLVGGSVMLLVRGRR